MVSNVNALNGIMPSGTFQYNPYTSYEQTEFVYKSKVG